ERLPPRPVGGGAACFPAASDEYAGATSLRLVDELVRQPRLADARFAAKQEETPASGARIVEPGSQRVELTIAADEDVTVGGHDRRRTLRQADPGVVPENPALQILQLGARLDGELVDEVRTTVGKDPERVGLPAGTVEREHQLRVEPLAERVIRD